MDKKATKTIYDWQGALLLVCHKMHIPSDNPSPSKCQSFKQVELKVGGKQIVISYEIISIHHT